MVTRVRTCDITYLVLDQELDTLNGGSGGLRDGSGDTTHYNGY